MNDKKYTLIPSGELTAFLDQALAGIAAEIEELHPPKLAQVVLGGGYGRGEGGVLHTPQGDRLYNDLDIFVFSDGAARSERREIEKTIAEISARWAEKLGVAVDFSPVKELSSLRGVSSTLMFQELRRGWKPIWGGDGFENHIPELDAAQLPVTEAVRLLLNRGMGLLLAGEALKDGGDGDFIVRNLNKSVLGGGDALLIASGRYRWSGVDRVEEFRRYAAENGMPPETAEYYAAAFRYKTEPHPHLPDDPWVEWRNCRRFFIGAARRVAGCADGAAPGEIEAGLHRIAQKERSVKNLLRWLRRRGGYRPPCAIFDAPVVTVAGMLCRMLAATEECPRCPENIRRLWGYFN